MIPPMFTAQRLPSNSLADRSCRRELGHRAWLVRLTCHRYSCSPFLQVKASLDVALWQCPQASSGAGLESWTILPWSGQQACRRSVICDSHEIAKLAKGE